MYFLYLQKIENLYGHGLQISAIGLKVATQYSYVALSFKPSIVSYTDSADLQSVPATVRHNTNIKYKLNIKYVFFVFTENR
ncbi:hypothetical protein D3C87_1221910 [compost metagenome]